MECNDPPVSAQLKRLIGRRFHFQSLVWSLGAVPVNPLTDDSLSLLDGFKVMEPNALLLHGSKQPLDHAVCYGMRRNELLFDAVTAPSP